MNDNVNLDSILAEYADSPDREKVKPTSTTTNAKPEQKPFHTPNGTQKTVKETMQESEKRKSIANSVKCAAVFGGLFVLIAYWQYTGQMAASAAVPSLCVCAALGGYGVGKNRSER